MTDRPPNRTPDCPSACPTDRPPNQTPDPPFTRPLDAGLVFHDVPDPDDSMSAGGNDDQAFFDVFDPDASSADAPQTGDGMSPSTVIVPPVLCRHRNERPGPQ